VSDALVIFSIREAEAELLYEVLTETAEAKLAKATNGYDRMVAQTLDHIADLVHTALHEADPTRT
jgi:hypothetical protein